MSNFFNKARIKVGMQSNKNKFDLSCTNITTQDFYKAKPVYLKEIIPGEKITIKSNVFSRLSPLATPAFTNIKIVNRAFFVPMRTIFEGFNNYITRSPYTYANSLPSIITSIPRVQEYVISTFFQTHCEDKGSAPIERSDIESYDSYTIKHTGASNPGIYDFNEGLEYYAFTTKGKILKDILLNLGYNINYGIMEDSCTVFSALPLLAYCKIFSDWYSNPAYSTQSYLDKYFKGAPQTLSIQSLEEIFDEIIYICYKSDYFTSAWDNPVGPNNNTEPAINIIDNTNINSNGTSISTGVPNGQGTPIIKRGSAGTNAIYSISQYMLDMVKHVTDYVTRHRLLGSRLIDRYLGEYGISLNDAKLNRSVYLGKQDAQVQISDVMQTSPDIVQGDSEATGVGNYYGKALAYDNNGTFEFSSDEFGYIIIISYPEPLISYVDGRPRHMFHGIANSFDFFTPEFDNISTQAIRRDELVTAGNFDGDVFFGDGVFGYAPRYAEYKSARDILSGDFYCNSRNKFLDTWITARRFLVKQNTDYSYLVHDKEFTLATGNKEFNRIFVDTNSFFDHFNTVFRFDVECYLPAKPLYDSFEFHSEGKELLHSVNGTQINN